MRASVASPRVASCSSANWRIVSSIENRVWPDDRSAMTNDLRTKASSRSSVVKSSSNPIPHRHFRGRIRRRTPNTVPAASSPDRRAGRTTTARRGAVSGGVPVRGVTPPAAGTDDRDGRAPRWRVIDAIRDAASSTANGIPSRRRQISATTSVVSAEKPCATAAERVRRTGRRPHSASSDRAPATPARRQRPSPSRLVAKILTVADCPRMASTRSAAASSRCSQLSNTRSRTLPSSAAATDSVRVLPGCWVMPSTAATASGTAAGSVTAASSKSHTPSGNSSVSCAATSSASRVLPTPPTPVKVTSRCARSAVFDLTDLRIAPDEARRRGSQIARAGVERPQWRKLLTQVRCPAPETARPGSAHHVVAAAPDRAESSPLTNAAVDSATRI